MAAIDLANTELIIIGGSAGSLRVVMRLMESIHHPLSVPLIILLHRNPGNDSRLRDLLAGKTKLNVKDIEDKDELQDGWIYVCPADYHTLVEPDRSISLDYSEKENFSRPSIDVLFRSAADAVGSGLLAILLSGASVDGAAGMAHIRTCGGQIIIQDPNEAEVSYMPEQAILQNEGSTVMTSDEIIKLLAQKK